MKDLHKLVAECQADLASIDISYGRVKTWVINCRAKARWGLCKKRSDGYFEIEISGALLDDNVSDVAAKNTIIHELSYHLQC